MPLAFSPLSEAVLESPPTVLLPKHAFVMRQLGKPPSLDVEMTNRVIDFFATKDTKTVDADSSTGGKDYLERILGLIRSTGFTVAIFSHETRPDTLANIALELGFAAMCGKPLVIVKSQEAVAPSDLKRTDWINYDPHDAAAFERKLDQALLEIANLHELENTLLQVTIEARCPDCAIALERANKGFLLSGERAFITSAEKILTILDGVKEGAGIADIERLRQETKTFIKQANKAMGAI